MRRLRTQRSERGATAVIVAVLLVALLGFTAIAVDVGALWWDRKQAQNGADAAALAIAQACAKGEGACADPNPSADDYANRNRLGVDDYVGTATVDMTTRQVTATVDTTRNHWFAPILGNDSSDVSARAVAAWGNPSRGSFLPLAISVCWFYFQTGSTEGSPPPTGTRFVIPLKSKSNSGATPDGPVTCGSHAAHNEAAGGFGWLKQTGDCESEIDLSIDPWVESDPGASSRDCSALALTVGETVLMPIFEAWTGSGSGVKYKIKAFAAFVVTDYCFGPGMAEATGWPGCKNLPLDPHDSGPNISGTFVRIVELSEALSGGGGTDMGALTVRLID